MSKNTGIKYLSPGILNLRCFGAGNVSLALKEPADEFIMHLSENDNKITIDSYTGRKNDTEGIEEKLLNFALAFGQKLGADRSVSIQIKNKIPFSAGLGKTETGIAALALSLRDLLKINIDKNRVFDLVCEVSSGMGFHIDLSSVAASIFGGIIAYDPHLHKKMMKIYCPTGLQVSVFSSPDFKSKSTWRDIKLTRDISSNIVGLTYGLMTSDLDIFSNAMRKNTVLGAISEYHYLFREIMDLSVLNGALGAGIADEQGSYFIVYGNSLIKDQNNKAIEDLLTNKGIEFKLYDTSVSLNGLYKA